METDTKEERQHLFDVAEHAWLLLHGRIDRTPSRAQGPRPEEGWEGRVDLHESRVRRMGCQRADLLPIYAKVVHIERSS